MGAAADGADDDVDILVPPPIPLPPAAKAAPGIPAPAVPVCVHAPLVPVAEALPAIHLHIDGNPDMHVTYDNYSHTSGNLRLLVVCTTRGHHR